MTAHAPAVREFVVDRSEKRMRLDRFLAGRAPEFSRSRIQALIREGAVRLDGRSARASQLLREGSCVTLIERPSEPIELARESMELSVLFEDGDIVVLNKPAGISVHPGAGQESGTLVNALLAHCRDLSGIGGKERPGIVHRLDKGTSGCLVVAKNDAAHINLSQQFAARTVEKIYLALVAGRLRSNSGLIDAAITRHRVHRKKMTVSKAAGGVREAQTEYRVVRSGTSATLLECRLHSGRTHQIRVHLQHLGHAVLGDPIYGGRRAGPFERQMLHARKLSFDHPRTKQRLKFEAAIPEDFAAAMRAVLST